MEFKIEGSVLNPKAILPKAVTHITNYVKTLPNGTLIPTSVLMDKMNRTTITKYTTHPAVTPYRVKHPNKTQILWGNAKTIKTFNKEYGKNNNS